MDNNKTTTIKGIAIILMFWHHLFGCGTLLTNGVSYDYYPFLFSFEEALARGGNLCIQLFAFVSGYGLYKRYICTPGYRGILKRIIKFLIPFWIILFFIAIPYLYYFNKLEIKYLLVSLFALIADENMLYVSLSWYVKVYLEFLLVLPILKLFTKKIKHFQTELLLFIIFPVIIGFWMPLSEQQYVNFPIFVASSVCVLLQWLPVFYCGIIWAKYNVSEQLKNAYIDGNTVSSLTLYIVSIVLMLISIILNYYHSFGEYTRVFTILLFVVGFDYFYELSKPHLSFCLKLFSFLGKYSFPLWLLSGMFFFNTTEFTNCLYFFRSKLLILTFNFIILLPIAMLIQKISTKINEFLFGAKFHSK